MRKEREQICVYIEGGVRSKRQCFGGLSDKDGGDKGETGIVRKERGRWRARFLVEEPLEMLCNFSKVGDQRMLQGERKWEGKEKKREGKTEPGGSGGEGGKKGEK